MTRDRTDEDSFWYELLEDQGVPTDVLDAVVAEGPLELWALERFILEDTPSFDVEAASAASGIPAETLRVFWRALGFPDPEPGDPTFTRSDLDMLATVLEYVDTGMLDETVALQMARVIGSSVARIASAQVEAADIHRTGLGPAEELSGWEDAQEVQRSVELLPMLSGVMENVWRRHLAVAVRRRAARSGGDGDQHTVTVGFADLEGFTALSQQLPEHELAEVINRFEQVAYDVVARFDARVVKMIGDEVMFAANDVRSGAELALALSAAYEADDALGDVRVGLATGPGLELEGDLYGPAVNLASRIVSIAFPGTVVVPAEIVEALESDGAFVFRPLRPHYLRHIGRVRLWAMRRSDEEPSGEHALLQARDRLAARRTWIAELMATRLADKAAETAGDATERAVRRLLEPRDPDG